MLIFMEIGRASCRERAGFMDKLAGTDKLRLAIEAGQTEQQIKQSWQADLSTFKRKRAPYLLYQ